MTGNRVEDLEATVAELESTVDGLTEELVEAKERIRVLESELDAETRATEPRTAPADDADAESDPDEVAETASEAAKAGEPQEGDEDADDSGLDDDIIVA